jgi:hypothetical protein
LKNEIEIHRLSNSHVSLGDGTPEASQTSSVELVGGGTLIVGSTGCTILGGTKIKWNGGKMLKIC